MEEIPFPHEESVEGVRQLSGALLHERGRGMWREAGNLSPTRGQFHHKQHVEGHQAMPGGIRNHGVRMSLPLRFFSKWVEWSSARGALKMASLPGPCQAV